MSAHQIHAMDEPLKKGEIMSMQQIIHVDRAHNYMGDEPSGEETYAGLTHAMKANHLFRAGESLFLGHPIDDGKGFEFHTCNADSAAHLIQNAHEFFVLLKSMGYTHALTHYDFPKITEMFKQVGFNVDCQPVNLGKHKAFVAKVSL